MISSYQEALNFLYDNLPMFQRQGAAAIKKDLTNTLKLCGLLGNPHLSFRSVHVGGTNGKGSTSHMLASVMQTAGYKTGLYTSPHLREFTERIKVDGQEVARDYVVDFVNRIRPAIEEIRPSFFEITVAMAFDYFARERVDIAIVEVGLGGRLDSTNVITPVVSVITNISWDHKDILGQTLVEIAGEKAGIIKRGIPVVISQRQQEVAGVFTRKAERENAEIFFASDEYEVFSEQADLLGVRDHSGKLVIGNLNLPLKGGYQKYNVAGVLKTIEVLRRYFVIGAAALKEGLEKVVSNTGLKGRWQILGNSPTVVCDTAHNEAGIREVVQQILRQQFNRLFIVLGMVKDKDVKQVLALLPVHALYYFCEAKIPRAMDALKLKQAALAFGLHGEVVRDVNEARKKAMADAGTDDFIFVGGSTYVVAELEDL